MENQLVNAAGSTQFATAVTVSESSEAAVMSRRGVLKLVLTAGLGLVAANAVPQISWANGTGLSRDGVRARFFIGSDLHITANASGEGRDSDKKLLYAFDTLYAIDPDLDAFCLVGDITDNGTVAQYQLLMKLLNDSRNVGYVSGRASGGKTELILCQGNHETYSPGVSAAPTRFAEQTGQQANKVVMVAGVPVITMGPCGPGDGTYTGNADFFREALTQVTDSSAPFLLLCHHQVRGTTYTSTEWYGTYGDDILAQMKAHPNMIMVSGHSHATIEDERSIGQDMGFTAIQDSTIGAYYENETGKVDPTSGSSASVPPQSSDLFGEGKTIAEASQGVILDVMEDGTARAYRISFTRTIAEGAGVVYLYEPWVIDVPGMAAANGDTTAAAYAYTSARESTAAPVLSGEVTVSDIAATSATVNFPAATPGSDKGCDLVHEYKITATPAAGGESVVRRVFGDYYRPAAYVRKNWNVALKGLAGGTEYTVNVVAQTSWNKEPGSEGSGSWQGSTTAPNSTSAALVSASFFTLDAPEAPRAILDIDYRTGSAEDAMGHVSKLFGASKIVDDAELGQKVLETDGTGGWRYELAQEDYDFFGGAHTAELLVKLTDNITSEQALFSNEESAGAGFEVAGNGGSNFEYWYNDGSYKVASAAAKANTWTHLLAVADGKTVTLYIDGVKVSSKSAGKLKVPSPKCYYVGCDTNGSMNPQFVSKAGTRIAFARLLPYAMSASQAAAAFAASKLAPAGEHLFDVDFSRASSAAEVADAYGHALTYAAPAAVLARDAELNRQVFECDGSSTFGFTFTEDDYARLVNEHALECLVMMGDLDADQCIFSNQQSAGDGLEVSGNSATAGKMSLWFNSETDGRTIIAGSIEKGKWHHVLASFDGAAVRLYIDGKLTQKEDARGGMKVPAEAARLFYIANDPDSSGAPSDTVVREGGKIAYARILSKAPAAERVAELAAAALTPVPATTATVTYAWANDDVPESAVLPDAVEVELGSELALPEAPVAGDKVAGNVNGVAGTWTFAGWDVQAGTEVTANMTVTGTWTFTAAGTGGSEGGNGGSEGGNGGSEGGNTGSGSGSSGNGSGSTGSGSGSGTGSAADKTGLPQTGDLFSLLGTTALAGVGAALAGAGLVAGNGHDDTDDEQDL